MLYGCAKGCRRILQDFGDLVFSRFFKLIKSQLNPDLTFSTTFMGCTTTPIHDFQKDPLEEA